MNIVIFTLFLTVSFFVHHKIVFRLKQKNLFQNMTIMALLKWISLFLHVIIWNDTVCCISSLQQTPEGKLLSFKHETMKSTGKTELGGQGGFLSMPCPVHYHNFVASQDKRERGDRSVWFHSQPTGESLLWDDQL